MVNKTFRTVSKTGLTSYNDKVLPSIVVTDEKHRARSEMAEQASRKGVQSHPLPDNAANGGRKGADPNSAAEVALNAGASVVVQWLPPGAMVSLHPRCMCTVHTCALFTKVYCSFVECQKIFNARHNKVNEAHLDIGCRGVNAFQASGLKSYEYVMLCFALFVVSVYKHKHQLLADEWRPTRLLRVCSFQSTFVEPMSHTILYGLVKAWLDLVCDSGNGIEVGGIKWHLTTTHDGVMSKMNKTIREIRLTSAYNRPARTLAGPSNKDDGYEVVYTTAVVQFSLLCLSSQFCYRSVGVSRWYFEEVSTFLELTGPLAFWSVQSELPPRMLEMWEHLHAYAMYFLYYTPGQHVKGQVKQAQNRLFYFAEFAEKHLKGRLCTLLLHRALVHIPAQVLDAWPGAFMREDFGERSIRSTKHKITHHATKNAAQASAQCCVLEMCLRWHKLQDPDIDAPRLKMVAAKKLPRADHGGVDGVQLHQKKLAYTGEAGDEVCMYSSCCLLYSSTSVSRLKLCI